MNKNFDEKDIQKLLRWKGSEMPPQEYFDNLHHSILERIRSEASSKGQVGWWNQITEHFDRASLNFNFKWALPVAAVLAVTGLIFVNQNTPPLEEQMVVTQPASGFRATDIQTPHPVASTVPGKFLNNLQSASYSSNQLVYPPTASPIPKTSLIKGDPHFPFGNSQNLNSYPTSKWPRENESSSQP
ncbi:MAG: hypothetical protein LR011_10005 [Verrucomicrobia bacterium]|nr:hypothetical protein [Verrucomicrobiota bacterium]